MLDAALKRGIQLGARLAKGPWPAGHARGNWSGKSVSPLVVPVLLGFGLVAGVGGVVAFT